MNFPRPRLAFGPVALATAVVLPLLTGCALTTNSPTSPIVQTLNMTGTVHGGQQPVTNAKIYLYAVGSYAGAPSVSILNGTGYVTTGAGGTFSINSDYTCPSYNTAISTYLLATGGNPGLPDTSTNNSAIVLMAALGPCNNLSSSTFVVINEASTVAAVTALQQFMVDPTHISAATLNIQPGYSAVENIPNAMLTVNNLVDLPSGNALAAPAIGTGVSPQAKLNSIANILSACVNTASPTSDACTSLFNATSPTGTATVSDVASAMLQIAKNPGHNVSTLFDQSQSFVAFSPFLSTAPNDLTLAIKFTGGGLTYPGQIISDNAGDIWLTNCPTCNGGTTADSIVGFSPSGSILTAPSGYTTNVYKPTAIAIDRYNGIWVTNSATGSKGSEVVRLSNTDGTIEYPIGNNSAAPTVGFPVALTGVPGGIALVEDNPSDAWITDTTNGRMVQIKYNGTQLAAVDTTGLSHPAGIAADGLDNLYLVGTGSNDVLQYNGTTGNFTTYTGAGLASPLNPAVDGGDHVWAVDTGTTKAVSELFGYTGAATSSSSGYTGINTATSVTLDGAGTAWIANCRASCTSSGSTAADNVVHLSATGTSLLTSDGIQDASLAQPTYSAIDISGNLWISNLSGASVTELVGVAAPVVTELETASSRHALPGVNYLLNPGFENGAQVKGDSTPNAIPSWTFSSTLSGNPTGTTQVDNSQPFSGLQKLTYYSGSSYQATESQTVTVPNGNYLVSCYVAGDPGSTTRTASLSVSGYNGSATLSNALANLTYSFAPYSVDNIPVTTGTLTVHLNVTETAGGYVGWDSCSVTKQ